jgi:uncharacterized protein (DUF2267 family)
LAADFERVDRIEKHAIVAVFADCSGRHGRQIQPVCESSEESANKESRALDRVLENMSESLSSLITANAAANLEREIAARRSVAGNGLR